MGVKLSNDISESTCLIDSPKFMYTPRVSTKVSKLEIFNFFFLDV